MELNVCVFSIGHYISDVYRPGSNLWKSYDDSTITEVCSTVCLYSNFNGALILLILIWLIFIFPTNRCQKLRLDNVVKHVDIYSSMLTSRSHDHCIVY